MADLTIRVLNNDQNPLEGISVRIEFTPWDRGMSGTEHTDGDGYANFSGYDEGPIKVYLDHSPYEEYHYKDGETIDITK